MVAGIGFAVSFQTIAELAAAHHLPGWPLLYPIGIDVGFLALAIESRRAIADKRSDVVPRALAWGLAGMTIYVNAHGAAAGDWLGRALHVVMPALWIVFLELGRWRRIARRRRAEKRDGIPLARWIAAPWSSLLMRRRMALRDTRSYGLAVELEDARRFARDLARAHYGRSWRRTAPRVLRARVRAGRLGDTVTAVATASVTAGATGGWETAVTEMVRSAITSGDKLTAAVKSERGEIARDSGEPEPSADRPARSRQPRPARPRGGGGSNRARVRALIAAHPGETNEQIAARAGVHARTVQRAKEGRPDLRSVAGG